jgi:SAM-dependent methyltransferase
VLEIGCGTGQLTEMLVERGLEVDAIDPGASLVEIALRRVGDGAVRFHAERFEDVDLPSRSFEAVFSGTAFHWIDPAVGWQKAANVLVPSGVLALLQSSLPELSKDWLAAGRAVLPEAATWRVRDPYDLWRGAEERLTNVADLWTWLGTHDLAQPQAATLYTDTRLLVVPVSHEETVESCLALLRTTSTYLRLDPDRRIALESRIADLLAATDGVRRSVELATLVTAKLAS